MARTDRELINHALSIVARSFVGLLSTQDDQGFPVSRWMGATSFDQGLASIYTLTGASTRKVAQIRKCPQVSWIFSSPHHQHVVTLFGAADIVLASEVPQHVFENLATCAQTYAMNALSDSSQVQFVLIRTDVQRLEYLSPAEGIFQPVCVTLDGDH